MKVLNRSEIICKFGLPKTYSVNQIAEFGANAFYYEIDAEAGIYLLAVENSSDETLLEHCDIRRGFAIAFAEVWGRIPASDRDVMSAFWVKTRSPNPTHPHPLIELEDKLPLAAAYDADSVTFRFSENAVEIAIRDDMLNQMIAHELGHAWWHTKTPNCHLTRPELNAQAEEKEIEANWKARMWEFDMRELLNWGNDHLIELGYAKEGDNLMERVFPDSFLGPDNLKDYEPFLSGCGCPSSGQGD